MCFRDSWTDEFKFKARIGFSWPLKIHFTAAPGEVKQAIDPHQPPVLHEAASLSKQTGFVLELISARKIFII